MEFEASKPIITLNFLPKLNFWKIFLRFQNLKMGILKYIFLKGGVLIGNIIKQTIIK